MRDSFSLSAISREPEEIEQFSIVVILVGNRRDKEELESQLKGAPSRIVRVFAGRHAYRLCLPLANG
ncbi:hypothetical protein [Jannaschia seohaensis]|uniref:Uncharacterized protein n=1 Tax=Jannaschia seohaensis TaxID=475081 RepID=A0A2Y9B5I5_9RHOB|nr:hypothetical protein [Jannaschia seohaensis]PWJ11759.1 hypothetical protein BCF38_11826 [Jannaschia seohaensis]SSA51275.1 hypothetical protein SAMN05421539_11826 [Jannaschia seohaensis]